VFLGTVGSTASFGTLAYATRRTSDTLEVRIWLSEQARDLRRGRRSDSIVSRRNPLPRVLDAREASIGGTVSVSTEDAARLTRRGEWPVAVASGTLGGRNLEPASDVNLLVTDGG